MRFVLPLIHFVPDSLRDSVPLFLKRQCGRTLGDERRLRARAPAPSGGRRNWQLARAGGGSENVPGVFPFRNTCSYGKGYVRSVFGVGRGHVSLLTNLDAWHSKLVREKGYLQCMNFLANLIFKYV